MTIYLLCVCANLKQEETLPSDVQRKSDGAKTPAVYNTILDDTTWWSWIVRALYIYI